MKIFFVRHGEGLDDTYQEIGGWADRELSPKGVETAFETAKNLTKLTTKAEIVYTSPLKRCTETADFLGHVLKLAVEESPYLKERNTYGLLSGVTKREAKTNYPEMYDEFKEGRYIPGAERYKDFVDRVGVFLEELKKIQKQTIICVTHGHFITVIIEEFLRLHRSYIKDGCILVVDMDEKGKLSLVKNMGVGVGKRSKKDKQNKRKFKK